ncbi:PBSX family phage terminase large subunit [Mucilaginibacter sp. L3T2-6]|uniref:PBSX family phage terminase large subunit n=1 Tax=Mucilaginibacter sp. L3T2-6 TaxID=3062491 RepID=UPI0026762CA1|nr:phage terminase large subunit [Mucilaginibacter sp. L3T2-6]MDO3644716.1 phage terminase large subunit [Mucilaginibacter sp. L3T2-6]MDV6217168.1 phage terminase large subunit [Mucilaginibacter sp. L3T2-6]
MVPQKASILFKHNYYSDKQIIVNQGGTSSGKTYSILQVIFCLACESAMQVFTVVGQDIPNLKAGALRDANNIFYSWPQLQALVKSYNRTDRVFEFHNGTIIEFKSYDDAQDAKSGKRDYLFINEANGISYDIYSELALRTRSKIFIDYNPNSAFWVHDKVMGRPGVQVIISDHRHNPFLPDQTKQKIEALKEEDEEQWRVYARGLTGKVSGLIFNNWLVCDEVPADAKLIAAGLNFGFSNDETGLVMVYKQDGELWIDEILYQTGLTNTDISARLTQKGISKNTDIIADSSEPKSIEDLRRLGWKITGAKKGADSINNSIDILRRYKLNVTRRSTNLREELSRYKWRTDRAGRTLNEPVDTWNHLIDPLRYVALNKLSSTAKNKRKSWLAPKPQIHNDWSPASSLLV